MANLTTNKNFLSPIGFQFSIDRTDFPNLEYFCSGVNLPALTLPESAVGYKGASVAFHGDRLDFSDLTITFGVTEDMENYKEIFDWMHRIIVNPADQAKQATLSVLNSHNNVTKEFLFKDVFPVALDGLEFDSKQGEVTYLTATCTFGYTSFEIK